MARCDVLIVGGGPAGSTCAWKLRGAGLDVLILDKKSFPRDKTCAGWITPAVLDELQIDCADYQRGRVLEPITAFATGLIGGAEVVTHYDRPISYGIRRCEFDHYLLARCGARLCLGQALEKIERSGDRWIVNGDIETPLIVGAGGHFCPVARSLGGRFSSPPPSPRGSDGRRELAVAAQEVEFAMDADQLRDCPVPMSTIHLYFCPDLRGYGWYYRKGNYLNVGLGREDNQNLGTQVAAFCADLRRQGKIPPPPKAAARRPESWDGVRFQGHAYLLYSHSTRPLIGDGALLIGDAAGLAYPQSGEGIRPAVESGLLASRTIQSARGRYHRASLEPYREAMSARFGKRTAWSISDAAPAALKRWLARPLLRSRWFARHVIVDRWFLHRHERPLE